MKTLRHYQAMLPSVRAAILGAAVFLAGCGGGSLYIGIDGSGDQPPRAELVADRTRVLPGQLVHLAAAVSDDSGYIDHVLFYRIDGGGSSLIVVATSPPFEAAFVAPADGRPSVSVYARAVDAQGQEGDSALLTIAIGP